MAASDDPLQHVAKMRGRLCDTAEHLRRDVGKVSDPVFRHMFGQAAEVLDRLVLAFDTYENRRQEPPYDPA